MIRKVLKLHKSLLRFKAAYFPSHFFSVFKMALEIKMTRNLAHFFGLVIGLFGPRESALLEFLASIFGVFFQRSYLRVFLLLNSELVLKRKKILMGNRAKTHVLKTLLALICFELFLGLFFHLKSIRSFLRV